MKVQHTKHKINIQTSAQHSQPHIDTDRHTNKHKQTHRHTTDTHKPNYDVSRACGMCVRSYFYRHKQLGQDDKHKLTAKWKSPISDASHSQRPAKTLVFLTREKKIPGQQSAGMSTLRWLRFLSRFFFISWRTTSTEERGPFPFGSRVRAAIG